MPLVGVQDALVNLAHMVDGHDAERVALISRNRETTYGEQGPSGPPIVEFTAVGTAIAPLAGSDPRRATSMPKPRLVVPLDR